MAVRLDLRAGRLDGALDHRPQVDPGLAEFQLVAADAADVEDVVHEPHHLAQLPLHHRTGLLPCLRLGRQAQQLQAVPQRDHRVAQFVGQGRQEHVLVAVGLL